MGLWSKVKGVFGRIGSGIKKGWDWLAGHKDKIDTVLDAAQQFVPSDKQQLVSSLRDKGEKIYGKASDIMGKYGGYL